MRKPFTIFLLAAYCLLPARYLYACPLCKEALEKMGEVWTSLGFNWSIYLMLAVPCVLVAGFVLVLFLNRRRSSRYPRLRVLL